MKPVNLKIGTDTYQDESGETKTRDEYPWGLRISLDNETIKRLGIDARMMPSVGDVISIAGMAKVVSVSTHSSDGDEQRSSIDLQVTDLAMMPPKRDEGRELKNAFYPEEDDE
ncbi:capsid staple protein [Cronobacter sakazakii]|uniref:capsid staple protein n=1 Tax=Cronobacter sakazakii TaxID=28141 RepID=UPI00097716C1|nr:hypothetical protein [Cronobacter sakazakii]